MPLADISGRAPRKEGSCVIDLTGDNAGCWHEWDDNSGGRPLSTLQNGTGLGGRALFKRAAEICGIRRPNGKAVNGHIHRVARQGDAAERKAREKAEEIRKAHEADRIWSQCQPIAGTIVAAYLQSRGLRDPGCRDLGHCDYPFPPSPIPGMVARLRDPVSGNEVAGVVHRTLLKGDGSGKADIPEPKMLLGHPKNGVVMLAPMTGDGRLGIAEGIETALSAMQMFEVPVWAGLSDGKVRQFVLPPGLRLLTIFADRREGGVKAAWALYHRACAHGIEARVYLPKSDDDFNVDLRQGHRADEYEPEQPTMLEPRSETGPEGQSDERLSTKAVPPARSVEQLIAAARALTPDSAFNGAVPELLREIVTSNIEPIARDGLVKIVKERIGRGAARGVDQVVAKLRREVGNRVGGAKASGGTRQLSIGSDVEIAEHVAKELRQQFGEIVFTDGDFWHYSGMYWEAINHSAARRAVYEYDGAIYLTPASNEVMVQLSKARIDSVLHEMGAMLAQPDFFAEAPAGINCASGFIAFDAAGNPSLHPHDPSHRCRHALQGPWQPGAIDGENPPRGSLLGRLLGGVFRGDPDAAKKRQLLTEVAGAAAVGYGPRLRRPKAVICVGEQAENGKSQVLDAIRSLLPATAVASVSANKFGDERHIIRLRGKLLNASDELSGSAIASDTFKSVTTGNPVSGRDVYRSAIEFRPVAQHLFAVNRLPKFRDGMDRGVRRRVLPVTFNRVIPVEERVEDIGQRVGREEPDLLLAFAVAGAQRLIKQRDFTVPPSSEEALRQWIYRDNPVLAWVEARVDPAEPPKPGEKVLAGIKSSFAHSQFRDWAVREGFVERDLPDISGFVQRLKENTLVPGISVKHTKNGNWLTGLQIRAVDREDDD